MFSNLSPTSLSPLINEAVLDHPNASLPIAGVMIKTKAVPTGRLLVALIHEVFPMMHSTRPPALLRNPRQHLLLMMLRMMTTSHVDLESFRLNLKLPNAVVKVVP